MRNDKKFNGSMNNRNNKMANFKLDTMKADLDGDKKISPYERARGTAIQKAMKKGGKA